MNYIYVLVGTIFTLIFVVQMMAFRAFTKKETVNAKQ